ncbi:polysaccharide biosynthesis tyrosine autokinase [Telluribacter sp. SYSU D00476]|uniref:GumC family protein n=1 Tax=Telluribacter sp. SYSU D00476 TaxID=2811430 RepID=UPI001FF2B13B|nr:polysaccharide biosynthesis tyrosine autokinase [Telluribacter sp. SYSU D00476]
MKNDNDSVFFEQLLSHSDSLDFQKLMKVLASRWYWIVGALLLTSILCFIYLKLATPQYVGSVTIKYLEKRSQLDDFANSQTTYLFNSGNTDYLTEKYNVKSQEVVQNAITKLNNPFTFYRLKDLRRIDVYPNRPLDLEVISYDRELYEHGTFVLEDDLSLTYQTQTSEVPIRLVERSLVSLRGLVFRVKTIAPNTEGYIYEFVFNDPVRLVNSFVSRIDMDEVEQDMPVMALSFRYHNPAFTKDFLDQLLEAYREFDLKQKQQSSDLTIRFINDQVDIYSASLKEAARELELFKQRNQVLDISNSATEITSKVRELEQRKNELEIQKAYINMLESNLGSTFEHVDYLSVGLDGTTDAVLVNLLERFNTLITQRKELLVKYSPNSSTVRNLDEELNKYRSQILDNIRLQKQKNNGTIRILDNNIAVFRRRFNQIPALEKNYIYLQSNFEVNKNIYSLLLNKEIESSIVRAGMLPSFQVVTQPDLDKVSPKPLQIIALSLFLGLGLGLGSVLATRYFNHTFTDMAQIDKHPRVSLLGIIHHFPGKVTNSSRDLNQFLSDRSVFTESISALRTRLSFSKSQLVEKKESGKQILITSEKSGEGKSFVTVNLALSLNKIGRKVIVIGGDLRKSRLHLFFDEHNRYGLSNLLQEESCDYDKFIYASTIPNLDYIPAGPAPFNPAELLQKPVFEDLLAYCRTHYDFVLLDTAPVGLVADNVPLLNQSDHILFIIRWLYSEKEAYRLPAQLSEEYDIKDVKVVVNDFYPDNLYSSLTSGSYYGSGYSHYRYGYAYNDNGYLSKPSPGWKKRIKNIFSVRKE